MKLTGARVEGFLRDPGPCRVVLLYGDDAGMIRERAETLVRAAAGSLDDPFLVAELTRDEISGLPDEAASLPLTGGRRVVRVREVTDAALPHVRSVLRSNAPALVVLEGAGLGTRARVTIEVEAASDGAGIACYPEEGRALETTIRDTMRQAGINIDPDAVSWLAGQLGGDRAATRAEREKLALYAGAGGRVDLDAAMACVGDLSGLSLDDALFAATVGDVGTTDRALELAIAEGAAPVQVLRAGMMHLQRLQRARMAMDEAGLSASGCCQSDTAATVLSSRRRLQPRVGEYGPRDAFRRRAEAWRKPERACKRTGWPGPIAVP